MCEKELSDQASQALDDLMCEFIKRYAPAKSWDILHLPKSLKCSIPFIRYLWKVFSMH